MFKILAALRWVGGLIVVVGAKSRTSPSFVCSLKLWTTQQTSTKDEKYDTITQGYHVFKGVLDKNEHQDHRLNRPCTWYTGNGLQTFCGCSRAYFVKLKQRTHRIWQSVAYYYVERATQCLHYDIGRHCEWESQAVMNDMACRSICSRKKLLIKLYSHNIYLGGGGGRKDCRI